MDVIRRTFPTVVWLTNADSNALLARIGAIGLTGGAVYDALVGEAARTHGCTLLTRDLRARRTYELLGVETRWVDVDG